MRGAKTIYLFFLFLMISTTFSLADDNAGNKQIHFRQGIIQMQYSGIIDSTMDSSTLLDIEYEVFTSNKISYFLRATTGMDYETNNSNYTAFE